MKIIMRLIGRLFLLLAITACGGGGDESTDDETTVPTLTIGESQTQFISTEGEVDTYQLRANEANRFLHLHCEEQTSGSGVDLLVTIFEETDDGQLRRLFGKHKPDGASLGADLDLWVYIDVPKDLTITVRDLMDDDASSDIPYHLLATFEDAADGNHDFFNALPLTVDGAAVSDAIEQVGEVDCFTFDVTDSGVFAVDVDHHQPVDGSPVQLALSLYDNDGNLIERLADPYHRILAYLTTIDGPYFLIVEDSDSLDGDAGAPYDIGIASVAVAEAQENDVMDDATVLDADSVGEFTAEGTIDYGASITLPDHVGDMDWYQFSFGEIGGATTYHQIQMTIDDGDLVEGTAPLRIVVYDDTLAMVTAHDFTSGSPAYQNQFRTENGTYFIAVAPANSKRLNQGTRYRIRLMESELIDTIETTDDNTANSAVDLVDDLPTEGWVSYPGDVDWYALDVDTTIPRILSVDLIAQAGIVDHQLSIWRGDQMLKKLTDLDGADGQTHLKTSILVPEDQTQAVATYHFKVGDAQNDEGTGISYEITASSLPVAGDPGEIAQTTGQTRRYYGEVEREDTESETVELEIFSSLQPSFKANTEWLDFRNPAAQGIEKTDLADGTTVITFPWVCGYVDYHDDRDFFRIDLGKLDPGGAETSWYYDVAIRLVVPDPGSEVEVVWKLYRDSNRNAIIMDDPTSPDGYKACDGDTTPTAVEALDLTTPTGDDTFWIGSQWGEDAYFYLGLGDFNYLRLPETNEINDEADNDWGYDAPYYFTITLTYHPGQAYPD